MPDPTTAYTRTFTIGNGRDLQNTLDQEAAAISAAGRLGHGLLVTRHDARTFTVESSPEVPTGTVHERDLFARHPRTSTTGPA